MYPEGDGIPQDLVQALKWEAIENRDKAILLMSPVQIADGRKVAREWKPAQQPTPTAQCAAAAPAFPADIHRFEART
jgi:hypothetical protein